MSQNGEAAIKMMLIIVDELSPVFAFFDCHKAMRYIGGPGNRTVARSAHFAQFYPVPQR